MEVGRAFGVEWLLEKTNNSNQPKTHERYCSTFTLPDSVPVEYDHAAIEASRFRRAVHPGSRNDAGHRTVDRTRRGLSNDTALVSYTLGVGNVVVDGYPKPSAQSRK